MSEPRASDEPAELPLPAALEAVLVVLDGPLVPDEVAAAAGVDVAEVVSALETLAETYRTQGRGFALRPGATGWRLYAVPAARRLLERLVVGEASVRMSNAALETLAVVAYQQPVSRSRIAAVRGVNVDAVVRTLAVRGLVTEVDTDPATGAVLYGTTPLFLDKLGITSLAELPDLAPLLPDIEGAQAIHSELSP